MAKKVNKTLIGGFVVGALALIVAGVLIFGSGKFFQESYKYVLFFKGSLKGIRGLTARVARASRRQTVLAGWLGADYKAVRPPKRGLADG